MDFLTSIPLFGSLANALLIMCGAAAGVLLRSRLPQRALELAAQGIALVVLILGTGMALKSEQPLIMTVSIAAGSLIGELLGIEGAFERAAGRLEIASSGSSSALNDAGDGTEEPWSWSLSLSAAFEAAEGSEKAAIFGVKYRQLF